MKGTFTPEMESAYRFTLEEGVNTNLIDSPDVVVVNDPQPLGLAHYLKKSGETWLWRCHIDIEETPMDLNPGLWDFMTSWIEHYDAAIFPPLSTRFQRKTGN
jgi:hypothetical protein